ncbi:MAG: hypothetical protein IJE89_02120 [Bacilli bacterium]|nr:hypothetical protein [Bacilli bacterium]
MVFRKPYGFLIKHFRLIHLIITCILVYLVTYSNKIYTFINNVIADPVNRYNALQYIDYRIYIFIVIALILFFIIYWLFKYKDKPRNIYILSIFGYILVAIYMFVLFSYFSGLPNEIVDQKTIRAYRDIMLMILGFQYLITIIMFLRGLGFDVKKFNFTKDIQELDLNYEDAEEVEVDLSLDATNVMRGVRKQKRELGYFFQEYKIFILGIIFTLLIVIGCLSYNYFSKKFKVYNEGDFVGYNYNISVKDSYYNIDSDTNYIIINFDVSKYGIKERLDVNKFILSIDKEEYIPNKNICYNFDDLGNCYKKQYITENVSNYILVYEVDVLNKESSYLIYKESYEDSFKIKLDLENYD